MKNNTSIDLRQVRILTRYALTSEWRMASMRSVRSRRKMNRGWAYWQIVIFLMIGALSIRLFVANATGEAFVTATAIFMLYVAFIIASNIFMSFGTGFLSPDESRIISLLPVSSETFFFSRLVVLVFYTTAISLLLSIGPMVGLQFFLRDTSWPILLLQNLAFFISTLLSGIAASLMVIVVYGMLMRMVGQANLSRMMGYVQFLGSFLTAMSFIALSQFEHRIDLHTITVSTMPWIASVPAYWFASLAALASGMDAGTYLLLALAAIVFLVILSALAHILLGKHYQSEVEEVSSSAARQAKEKKSNGDSIIYRLYIRFARSDESRAMFQVLHAQFRYDAKFRMQFLAALPPTFLYLFIAVMKGGIVDPFGGDWHHIAQANMLYLVAMLMPLISMQAISQSENYKAAWIFFSAPVDRAKLLLAVRNMLLTSIIVPYMIILAIIFCYYMPILHAIAHTLVLAALAGFIFQIYLMIAPKMPFAQQRRPNRGGFAMMAGVMFFAILGFGLLALILMYGYRSQARFWPIFAALVTVSAALEGAVHARIRKKLEREEFEM